MPGAYASRKSTTAGDLAPWFVVLGIKQSKEYAEPEWCADLWLTVVWGDVCARVSRHHHASQGSV
jgi:hypothetical protein